MRTNIDIDDELMAKIIQVSGAATKKAAVEEAMRFYLQVKAQRSIFKLAGKVKFFEGYDHREMRKDRFPGDWEIDEKAVAKLSKSMDKLRKSRAAA